MKLSLSYWLSAVIGAMQRFGLAFAFLLALGSVSLLQIWSEKSLWSDYEFGVLIYYTSVGLLLSLVLQLWGEERVSRSRQVIVGTLGHGLLLVDSLWLWSLSSDAFSTGLGIGHLSAIVSLGLALFFLPFFRERDDLPSWHFALQVFVGAAVALLVGSIMTGGLCLLISSLDLLFGISLDWEWYGTTAVLFELMLPILLWMSRFPQGDNKHCHHIVPSNFLTGVVRFLFLPLLGLYVFVLYIYALTILVQWELPNGGVGWMVSVLTFGTIALTFTLYPAMQQRPNAWECRAVRWLSIVILPLLLLMTIGICRRLSDYGVTEMRLYALLLNIWFYGVCIGLFVTRARRIHWVALSFGTLFLLSSALPINFSTIALSARKVKLQELWASFPPPNSPMNQSQFETWLQHYQGKRRAAIVENLRYIESRYNEKEVAQWVKSDVSLWANDYAQAEVAKQAGEILLRAEIREAINVPQGFGKVIYIPYLNVDYSWKDSTAIISFQFSERVGKQEGKEAEYTTVDDSVRATIHELSTLNDDNLHLRFFPTISGKYHLVLESIEGSYVPNNPEASSLRVSGAYVFFRK